MKRSIGSWVFGLAFLVSGLSFGQTAGSFWIKTFEPGSANLEDPMVDRQTLAQLDSLMLDQDVEVTFLGAADSLAWRFNGKRVNEKVGEAWNDAKRLSRARALRARYGRGEIGVSHESVAGVKVVWEKAKPDITNELTQIRNENRKLQEELGRLRGEVEDIQSSGPSDVYVKDSSLFNWGLEAGFWTWKSGSTGDLVSPSLALNIIIDRAAFVLMGGVTPWHTSSPFGNQAESFVYMGTKYMKTDVVGLTIGVFRGWEFFTATDDWSFKTTGIATGIVFEQGFVEFNPALTYSNVNTLESESEWRVGLNLGLSVNVNKAF
jgi:hypothetical protein